MNYQLPRLFVDIDGTMAEWKSSKFEDLHEENYFYNLRPYQNVIAAIKIIAKSKKVELFSLSAILVDSRYAVRDKNRWIDEFVNNNNAIEIIDDVHRIFVPTGTKKSDCVPGGIRPSDILLDDYTVNLAEWPAIAIKLLNGVNGTKGTWTGPKVWSVLTPDEIAEYILSFVQG